MICLWIALGFFHEIMRLDRDSYVDVNFTAIQEYEKALNLPNGTKQNQYLRCDQHRVGTKMGCQAIGNYDANSILHYPPTLTAQVIENGQLVDKTFTVFTLKQSAHGLCEGGRCNPGQRNGLSRTDITDIQTLYATTCSKKIIKNYFICKS